MSKRRASLEPFEIEIFFLKKKIGVASEGTTFQEFVEDNFEKIGTLYSKYTGLPLEEFDAEYLWHEKEEHFTFTFATSRNSKPKQLDTWLAVSLLDGDYEDVFDEELRFVAFDWLFGEVQMDLESALVASGNDEVLVSAEHLSNYAYDHIDEIYGVPDIIKNFIDYEAFGLFLERNGAVETYDDYIITNPQDF